MIKPLSLLSIVLLIIQGVTSDELYESKSVQQNFREVGTPYRLNHPPSIETHVPVTVLYDEEEDIRVFGKSVKQAKITTENFRKSIFDDLTRNTSNVSEPEKDYEGSSPTVEKYDDIKGNKYSENTESSGSNKTDQEKTDIDKTIDVKNSSVVKPAGRALDNGAVAPNNDEHPGSKRKHTQRRRLQNRIRKVKVNKILATNNNNHDKPENTVQKVAEVRLPKIAEAPKNNDELPTNTKFQRRTQQRGPVVPIIDSENYVYAYHGDYHYSYEGGDGTKAFERGELKTVEGGTSGAGVVGGFSYKDQDGNDFSLSYTADENGYRPVGAHLPTPPPIPPAIQAALALLATKTTPEPITERVNKPY